MVLERLVFECRKICIRYKNNGDGAGIPLRVYIETGARRGASESRA